MNELHDLLAKIRKIDEAPAVNLNDPARDANGNLPAAAQPAVATAAQPAAAQILKPETGDETFTRRENANKAKAILKNMVKKANDLFMVNGYYIEDGGKTGTLLHHMMANSRGSGATDQGTVVTTKDLSFGQGKEFSDQLTGIGLKITPQVIQNPGIFGWKWTQSEKTVLTVNLDDLRKIAEGKPPMMDAPPPPAPAPVVQVAPPAQNDQQVATNGADPKDIAELTDILKKLGATIPSKFSISSAPNNLGPRQTGLGGSLYEGITFKSSIGRSLLAELDAAQTTQAQYDIDKQILTYNGKQYTWNPQAQVSGQGTVVSAPSMAVGSRGMGSTNVELNTDGTYTKTDRAPTAPATTAQSDTLPPPSAGQLSPDERTKLIARAKTLYDKLLPYKDNLEVSPLLAAYLTAQKESPAPVQPEVRPVPTVRIEPHTIPDPNVKPPVEVVPPKKRENDQETTPYPASWMKVPIEPAPSQAGPGPNGEGVYYLGKGTPEQALGFADRRNNTLVPMVKNSQQADKRYAPIPWGDKRFPWISARGGVTTVDNSKRPGLDPKKGDPKIWDRQKQLRDAGAKNKKGKPVGGPLNTDGIMGDDTRAAEKEFGAKVAPIADKGAVPSETATDREIISYIDQQFPKAEYGNYFWVNGRRWKLVANGKGTNRYIWREDNPLNTLFGQNADRTEKKYTGPDDSPESGQEVVVTPQKEDDALRYAIQSHINMGSPDSRPTAQTVIKMADWYRKHPDELQKEMKKIGMKPTAVKEGVGFANDELNRIMSLVHHR